VPCIHLQLDGGAAQRRSTTQPGVIMTDTIDDLRTAILRDLVHSRVELDEARRRQRDKDSPGNRDAVVACLIDVDALLDSYLATDARRR
jgi:hypothetical protein